jgi:hypothetical protein
MSYAAGIAMKSRTLIQESPGMTCGKRWRIQNTLLVGARGAGECRGCHVWRRGVFLRALPVSVEADAMSDKIKEFLTGKRATLEKKGAEGHDDTWQTTEILLTELGGSARALKGIFRLKVTIASGHRCRQDSRALRGLLSRVREVR